MNILRSLRVALAVTGYDYSRLYNRLLSLITACCCVWLLTLPIMIPVMDLTILRTGFTITLLSSLLQFLFPIRIYKR